MVNNSLRAGFKVNDGVAQFEWDRSQVTGCIITKKEEGGYRTAVCEKEKTDVTGHISEMYF